MINGRTLALTSVAALSLACSQPASPADAVDVQADATDVLAHDALMPSDGIEVATDAPMVSDVVDVADAAATERYAGVNLAGAEFAPGTLPGTYATTYIYPTDSEFDYFHGRGMNIIRVPFLWERLQPTLRTELDASEIARIDAVVTSATGRGLTVILDPHDYARYRGEVIGGSGSTVQASDFADFWSRLATHFISNPHVMFGLMNEPNGMPTELWRDDANAAITAIRATGATQWILVPGNGYTGAHSWNDSWYGTANGTVMLGIVDPMDHYAFEAHQYLDSDSSGTSATCVTATIGAERLQAFTTWLHTNHRRGFLGEVGSGSDATCLTAIDGMLTYLDANRDVWLGWTWWAAGPWWGSYFSSIEPMGTTDAPQMTVLARHL